MSNYLPAKKTYAVCSSQLGASYSTFIVHPDLRGKKNITVSFKGASYPLLTIKDRKLGEEFSCKTCWSSGVGTIAFGAGVMTGLAIAATIAPVPVLGWIAGGAIALGCLAYGLYELFSTPTCNQMIEYDESEWITPHQTTTFDTHLAVVKMSFIKCKEGGMIMPFISEVAAKNAADSVSKCNKVDMGINVLGNFIGGGLFGFTLGYSGILSAGKSFIMGLAGAFIVIQPLMKLESAAIRGVGENVMDNPYYDNMNENNQISIEPTMPTSPADAQAGVTDVPKALKEIRELAKSEGATRGQLGEIDAAIKTSESNGGSVAGKNNPEAKIVFDKAKNGEYGSKVKEVFTNSKGDGRGMNRQGNYEKAINEKNQVLNKTLQEQKITGATNKLNILTLIIPFVSVALYETALISLANNLNDDFDSDLSILATEY